MKILKNIDDEERIGKFIDAAFSDYAKSNEVDLNYEEYWFVAEDDSGEILGTITGHAYYNEVHIGDLIIDKKFRGQNIGTKLVQAVEEEYKGKGFEKISLTTFGFQAPGFYKKLGYETEFVRVDKDPKLSKYFLAKPLEA